MLTKTRQNKQRAPIYHSISLSKTIQCIQLLSCTCFNICLLLYNFFTASIKTELKGWRDLIDIKWQKTLIKVGEGGEGNL